jgi:ABC-type uncharacterized transport system ATPase subunit
VEIIKALVRQANVLILDEPTAVLTPAETEDLFRIIRQLRDGGLHHLHLAQAQGSPGHRRQDHRAAPRRGRRRAGAVRDRGRARRLDGRPGRPAQGEQGRGPAGSAVLRVTDLTVRGDDGRAWVDELSFDVRAGEILGIAGVQGNGQTELCEALMGLRPTAGGTVALGDRDLTRATPQARLRAGIAYVPEDRTEDGLVGSFSVAENLVLDLYNQKPFASGINLNLPAISRTPPRGSRSSTSAPGRPPPRRARCPAATSRRSSWPGNSAASTRC